MVTRADSADSNASLKSPRTPRFIEATAVNSPVDGPSDAGRAPFNEQQAKTQHLVPQAQPGDIGFGYIGDRASQHYGQQVVEMPMTPKSPLKSALKSPGAPPRQITQNPLSPTWREEEDLEKQEGVTEKEQAKDLRVKVRVRVAKMALRFTNFSCSLIVLAMISTTFTIFNASRSLPPRNSLPPWATSTVKWPAILLLVISCISLFMSIVVFYGYWRGGHRRAEKAAVYYTVFSVGFFGFSIIMWGVGAAALQQTHNNAGGNDIWGWSCKNNPRKTLFENEVNYDLVCRLQNWSLVCCLIEVIVEVITILIYGIVFYRYYSKRRLRKTMAKRDTARSDLYLAQLRSQSAPNTPGLKSPLSPGMGGYNPAYSPRFAGAEKQQASQGSINEIAANEEGVRYITAPSQPSSEKPFQLARPPPKKNTPKQEQNGFDTSMTLHQPIPQRATAVSPAPATPGPQSPGPASPGLARSETPKHQPAAPGEQTYAAVPIPGAYASPINSPTHPPNTATAATFQSLH
ncbi:MAG: hypothetical protein Q9162_005341 [Coniocarpon cinnabarinum]